MNKEDFFYLGRILKSHGNKGHVLVLFDVDNPENYAGLDAVYLDLHGERVPFVIESLELKHNRKAAVRFEDFGSPDDAEALAGFEMYLPSDALPKLSGKKFYYHEIKGFRVNDLNHGEIGIVKDVLELPHQSLLQVMHGDREVLIPIVDEVIRKVDRRCKTLTIKAPDGLIEIYL